MRTFPTIRCSSEVIQACPSRPYASRPPGPVRGRQPEPGHNNCDRDDCVLNAPRLDSPGVEGRSRGRVVGVPGRTHACACKSARIPVTDVPKATRKHACIRMHAHGCAGGTRNLQKSCPGRNRTPRGPNRTCCRPCLDTPWCMRRSDSVCHAQATLLAPQAIVLAPQAGFF